MAWRFLAPRLQSAPWSIDLVLSEAWLVLRALVFQVSPTEAPYCQGARMIHAFRPQAMLRSKQVVSHTFRTEH
jgi:hypothetical protein